MRFRFLGPMLALVKEYTAFSSYAAIGQAIGGKSDSAVRNWIGDIGHASGEVPDAVGEEIITFIQDRLPRPTSRAEVRRLLEGHPVHFHNAICPIASLAWSQLLSQTHAAQPPQVDIRPPRRTGLGFGQHEDFEPEFEFDMGAGWRYRFAVAPPRSSSGEVCLLSERNGMWLPSAFADGAPTELVTGSPWWVPSQSDNAARFFVNDGSLGVFRHVLIGVDGRLPKLAREALASVTPLDTVTLDLLGGAILELPQNRRVVATTTIRVQDT